jgi:hypothetical protein
MLFFLDDVGYQIWSRNVLQIRPNGRVGRAKARERNAQKEDFGRAQWRWVVNGYI